MDPWLTDDIKESLFRPCLEVSGHIGRRLNNRLRMGLGYPPKLIWLQIENWSTDQVEELIRSRYPRIAELRGAIDRAILVLFEIRGLTSR